MIRRFDIDTDPIYQVAELIVIPNLMEGRYANYKETLAKGAADEREKWAEEKALLNEVADTVRLYRARRKFGPCVESFECLDRLDNYRNTSKGEGGE
jgi:hypothetical protein